LAVDLGTLVRLCRPFGMFFLGSAAASDSRYWLPGGEPVGPDFSRSAREGEANDVLHCGESRFRGRKSL